MFLNSDFFQLLGIFFFAFFLEEIEKNIEVKNMKGKIKWFNSRKGFGFIIDDNGNDIFVHQNDISPGTRLFENDQVEFEKEDSERGPKATKVKKIE